MTDKKEEVKDLEKSSEKERREFLSKTVTALGAVAAGSLLAGIVSSEAEAQQVKVAEPGHIAPRRELVSAAPLRYAKLQNGHSFSIGGPELTKILAREQVIPQGVANKNAVMKLVLEWS